MDHPTPSPPSLRPPQQQRSRETFERILAATERLLEHTLFDDLPIQLIVREAGLSTGAFYARFTSKDAMLPALIERYYDSLTASALQLYARVPEDADLHARAHALITERVHRYRQRRGLLRSLVAIGRSRPQAIHPEIGRRAARAGQALLEFMEPVLHEVRHPQPAAAIDRAFFFVSAICREAVLFPQGPHASEVPMSDEILIEELTRMFIAYTQSLPPGTDTA